MATLTYLEAIRQALWDEMEQDEMPFDLLDGLANEADPRAELLRQAMRKRGWSGWNRMERVD